VRTIPLIAAALTFAASQARGQDLLPDLIINETAFNYPDSVTEPFEYVTDIIPGRVHIRFSNATPNIGDGPLFVHGGEVVGTGQVVYQRIFQSGGGFRDREAGFFVFHPAHSHVHVNRWAEYRIRAVLPGDGVGPILRKGGKTSFCLLDSRRYDASGSSTPTFRSCGSDMQGISLGWEDLYTKNLADQWIDITGLSPGEYWLESEVDPFNQFQEIDETNNVGRVKITISPGELPVPDEIPLDRGLPWYASIVLLLVGAGALALKAGRRGTTSQ
jgi:hypothetical protein